MYQSVLFLIHMYTYHVYQSLLILIDMQTGSAVCVRDSTETASGKLQGVGWVRWGGGGGGAGSTKILRIKDSFGNERKVKNSLFCHNGRHNIGNTVLDLFEN